MVVGLRFEGMAAARVSRDTASFQQQTTYRLNACFPRQYTYRITFCQVKQNAMDTREERGERMGNRQPAIGKKTGKAAHFFGGKTSVMEPATISAARANVSDSVG
jgi:c-di-AMP phosphodiesterase-like protein